MNAVLDDAALGRMMETVRILSTIPDRTPTADGERLAAELFSDRLVELGAQVEIQPFETYPHLWKLFAYHSGLAMAGGILGLPFPVLGAMVAGTAAASLHQELTRGFDLVRRVLPKGTSQNVLGVFRAGDGGTCKRRIILSAHLDAAFISPVFNPVLARKLAAFANKTVGRAPALGDMAFHSIWPIAAVSLARSVPGLRKALLPLQLGLVAFQLSSLVPNSLSFFAHKPCPGANDDASGIAVILEAARRFAENPIPGVELWVLGTGAEEAHLQGISHFFSMEGAPGRRLESERDWFINLDTVGLGRLRYLSSDGMIRPQYASDKVMKLVGEMVAQEEFSGLEPLDMRLATDGMVTTRAGFPTVSLVAMDEHCYVEGYHWHTDCVDNVDPRCLGEAFRVTVELMSRIAHLS